MDAMDIFLNVLIVLAVILVVIVLVGIIAIEIRNATLDYEEIHSTAVVLRLEYKKLYTTVRFIGKVRSVEPYREKYNIYLLYEGTEYSIDDEQHFNILNKGDNVNVIVHKGYNKKGEVKNVFLTFEY